MLDVLGQLRKNVLDVISRAVIGKRPTLQAFAGSSPSSPPLFFIDNYRDDEANVIVRDYLGTRLLLIY